MATKKIFTTGVTMLPIVDGRLGLLHIYRYAIQRYLLSCMMPVKSMTHAHSLHIFNVKTY